MANDEREKGNENLKLAESEMEIEKIVKKITKLEEKKAKSINTLLYNYSFTLELVHS